MRGFEMSFSGRAWNDVLTPVRLAVGPVVVDARRGYACAFDCDLFGGGVLYGPLPEWVYSRVLAFVRYEFDYRQLKPVDAGGTVIEIGPPDVAVRASHYFPAIDFAGLQHRPDGSVVPFTASVRPPVEDAEPGEVDGRRLWRSHGTCSLIEVKSAMMSDWPEHSYELAFSLLRNLLAGGGERLTDNDGRPLLLHAALPR